jgi:iron complex outermembrane receptor protein
MSSQTRPRASTRLLLGTCAGAALLIGAPGAVLAQSADGGSGATTVNEVVVVAHAIHVSPSAVPLDKTQPTSNIQKEFIQNNIVALASFDDIVKFSPSVSDQSPNGPGLGKSETLSIRGFQDGEFNVTFDGIPFGDATDFHHTSSALFIAHDIGEAQIDRGPGSASTFGDATFGGSMNFLTKAPLDRLTVNPYATFGSFDTRAYGVELDTGPIEKVGRAFIDAQNETSNGYLTHATEQRTNLMFKDVTDLNPRVTITTEASYNKAFEYTTQGTTLANIQKYGPNFALNNNPATQAYYGYQPSNYTSDFEYVDVKAKLWAGWSVDNKIYTDSFGHDYTESKDASDTNPADNGVTYYSAAGKKLSPQPAGAASDVPGKLTDANFRAFGDTLRFTDELPIGQLQAGLWVDYNKDYRWSEATDLTHGNVPTGSKSGTPYSYYINDTLTTIEPYVELDWDVTPDLTVTPGVRYSNFRRTYDAPVNKAANTAGLHTAADYSGIYQSVQPSIAAHYTIQPGWSAYAQIAKGFLAPPINVVEVDTTTAPSINPEETWNYQVGTAYHGGRWVLGLDAYYIDFSNFITASAPSAGITTYVNGGGAIYEGVEFEGQYVLPHGFSLYANASYNKSHYKQATNVWLAEAPEWTAAAGLLYDDRRGPFASLIAKWIGSRYGLDVPLVAPTSGPDLGNQFGFDPYVTADFAAGWRFSHISSTLKDISISVKVSNIFDNRELDDYAGQQAAAAVSNVPLYWTVAGRSAFVNLSASF